jgi:uncharacterized protein
MDHQPPPDDVWVDDRVAVRASVIEGNGLFATGDIGLGDIVLGLGGRLVDSAELELLIAAATTDPEAAYVDTITVYDGAHLVLPPGTPVHFCNHSCDPNRWHDGPFSIVVRRPVASGEELTVDYGTNSGADGFVMACRCGSPICRGTITSDDWQQPELQRRYAGHWTPALQQRIDRH